jgi:hypothetical protein
MMPDTFSDAHERDGEVPSAPGAHQAACAEYLVIWVWAGHQQGATARGPRWLLRQGLSPCTLRCPRKSGIEYNGIGDLKPSPYM